MWSFFGGVIFRNEDAIFCHIPRFVIYAHDLHIESSRIAREKYLDTIWVEAIDFDFFDIFLIIFE